MAEGAANWRSRINWDYFLILLLGIHVFYWFKGSLLYIGGDYGIPLNPLSNLEHLYLWKTQLCGVESWNLTLFFQYFSFALMNLLNLSIVNSQRFYIYLMHSLIGISMYYMCSGFNGTTRLSRMVAAVFYMFNPFMLGLVLVPTFNT